MDTIPGPVMRASLLIIPRGEDIFITRRFNTGYRDGWYQVPAGKVETDEQPSEAAIREGDEEAGILVKKVRAVGVMHRPKHDASGDRVDFIFVAEEYEGEPHNGEPDKCDDSRWCNVHELPQDMIPHLRLAVERWLAGEFYTEVSREFLKENGYYE
ncbi:MAG: hypothetical protein JWL88_111 [Parcubacteria group bacterium]|nr:hypothetical protein [Parcubacteria group bacterium]